jgi:hypothetical protein
MTTSDGTVLGMAPVVANGPPELLLNIVVVADGFYERDMPEFAHAVDRFSDALLRTSPFDRARCGINVFRIDVASVDRGADTPLECGGNGFEARTYFDASFCAYGVPRGISVDEGLAIDVVGQFVPAWHLVIVLVNSDLRGGMGGQIAKVSLQGGLGDWIDVMIHEMGHSLFGLADEYEYLLGCGLDTGRNRWPSFLGIRVEPGEPNITIWRDRQGLKWRDLVDDSTSIPTLLNPDCTMCAPGTSPVPVGVVGLFEGAGTYHCDAFRPEFSCRMRNATRDFCAVCERVASATLDPYHRLAVSLLAPRVQRVNEHATSAGYVGGVPNFHETDAAFGSLLVRAGAAQAQALSAGALGDPQGFEARFRAVNDSAAASGFVAGFPTFSDAPDGATLGAVLLSADAADVREVAAGDLGDPRSTPERFRAASDYALATGYAGGFPTLHPVDGAPDAVHRCVLVRPSAADLQDVPISDFCPVVRRARDAEFVTQVVPSEMVGGQPAVVHVTMRNTGTETWTAAGAYRLGSQETQDNLLWGLGRVDVPSTVPPGSSAQFAFTVVPPAHYGPQPFRWRMLQEGVAWFGDFTPVRTVKVKLPGDRVSVPDVRELRTPAAVTIIRAAGLTAVTPGPSGSNSFVEAQQPDPETEVDRGSAVHLQTREGEQQ